MKAIKLQFEIAKAIKLRKSKKVSAEKQLRLDQASAYEVGSVEYNFYMSLAEKTK